MSIIKRKAGSEDIVKSILEFDEVPTEGSPNLVESGAVAQAIGNTVKAAAIAPIFSTSGTYKAGDAVMYNGKRYVSNESQTMVEWDSAKWTEQDVETDIVTLKSAISSIKNGGAITDSASVDVTNNALSTLATAQATLTLNVNVDADEVPNFAVEVTPSADCTLTVTKTVGSTTTTLNPSAAGGDSLTTGKLYQVTCVGSCWTLAEFTVPTP